MHNWKPRMEKTLKLLAEQLRGIRSGSVTVGLIENLRIVRHGNLVPIKQLGVLKSHGDRILIAPFDRADVAVIVKTLAELQLSVYALNPTTVSVNRPPISVEERQKTSRHVKKLGEEAKIAIRALRQQARKQIEASGRGSQRAVQESNDAAIAGIERLVQTKLAELA
jgi:ribosome recycling factor